MSERFDIAVIGAGAAGIAAAISSARRGRKTLLIDERPAAGGTGGFSGLTTLCGLFDSDGEYLNNGFSREFAEAVGEGKPLRMGKVWVLQYRPEQFRSVADSLLSANTNLQTQFNTKVKEAAVHEDRIVRVNEIEVSAVVDCSGNGAIAQVAGAECIETDETTQAPAVIFALHQVTRRFSGAADIAQVLLPLARAGFPPLNFHSNLDGSITIKFSGPSGQVPQLIHFLQENIPGFENCISPQNTFSATPRAGRMIKGEYLLSGEDVLAGRKFSDAVARCAWPIEQWGADGIARFKYLATKSSYDIPSRSLRAARLKNLFMAGKTISADVEAIASARVMGCCLATGAAAGNLAADYVTFSSEK